jgi:hypothetical protein
VCTSNTIKESVQPYRDNLNYQGTELHSVHVETITISMLSPCIVAYQQKNHLSMPWILRTDFDSSSANSALEQINLVSDSDSKEDGIHRAIDLEAAVLEAGIYVVAGMSGVVSQPAHQRIKEESGVDPSPDATGDGEDANRALGMDTTAVRSTIGRPRKAMMATGHKRDST